MPASHRAWSNAAAGTLYTGRATVHSINISASAAGTTQIFDNTAASGPLILVEELAAGETFKVDFPGGINVATGIHVVQGGTAEGAILVT